MPTDNIELFFVIRSPGVPVTPGDDGYRSHPVRVPREIFERALQSSQGVEKNLGAFTEQKKARALIVTDKDALKLSVNLPVPFLGTPIITTQLADYYYAELTKDALAPRVSHAATAQAPMTPRGTGSLLSTRPSGPR